MAKKILNEKKFLLVIIFDQMENFKETLAILKNNPPSIPLGYDFEFTLVDGKNNLAKSLNSIQKNFDARYKIYLTSPVKYIRTTFLMDIFNNFFRFPKVGMLGLLGSEMPIDGDYTKAENFYGQYAYIDEGGELQYYQGKQALLTQSVHILESSFFATCEDIKWDENVGEDFLFVAQCLKYRKAGYNITVVYQQFEWLVFSRDNFSYNFKENQKNYESQLEIFQKLYKNEISPLVSILIPTYNQPKFVLEALESALNQTYPNIEILIGDDSTNEDTKKAIQPYLKKYKNLKYFFHNGKIPRGGRANYVFLSENCHGDFVNFLFHDDLFYPEKISKMMNYYVRDLEEKISLVTSTRDIIDENAKNLKVIHLWNAKADTILRGENVGRIILFQQTNFIGELTTVLLKRDSLKFKDMDGNVSFMFGGFCGVFDVAFGDIPTFLNIAKDNGDFVFIAEPLSAFRQHGGQNTNKPLIKLNLASDSLNFITLSWLNNLFLRDEEDYKLCCKNWLPVVRDWFRDVEGYDFKEFESIKIKLLKVKEVFEKGNCDDMLDAAISFLLSRLPKKNPVLGLVKKNKITGRWEKIDNNIMTCVFQDDY